MVHHPFQCVELGGHLFTEVLHLCVADHLQTFSQLILVVHRGQLQVTLHLLPDLLETIDDRHTRDAINSIQRLQTNVGQFVFSCYLAEMDN